MRLNISHLTRYHYDEPVPFAVQQLRLTPKSAHGQSVLSWQVEVEGGSVEVEYEDHHLNVVQLVSFEPGRTDITVRCRGEVETVDNAGILGAHRGNAPLWLYQRSTALTRPGAGIRRLVRDLGTDFESDVARLHALSGHVAESVAYRTGTTDALTDAESALESGAGVCQDHAHIFITAARHMGYPARYVGGYLMMNDRVDQDAGHAWAEVHVPALGWVAFDVSNGISPDARYIRVATGLDYSDCAPTTGLRRGSANEHMIVSLQVQQ